MQFSLQSNAFQECLVKATFDQSDCSECYLKQDDNCLLLVSQVIDQVPKEEERENIHHLSIIVEKSMISLSHILFASSIIRLNNLVNVCGQDDCTEHKVFESSGENHKELPTSFSVAILR